MKSYKAPTLPKLCLYYARRAMLGGCKYLASNQQHPIPNRPL